MQRLRQIVEGLTSLARLDAGHVERDAERLRGAELATAAFAREERSLLNAGCVARLEITDDPELDGHEALLLVALTNLLRNAERHAPGATVVMGVTRDDDRVVFTVDDDGPGLEEPPEMAFDRFSRGRSARTFDRSGLGLGLPIAREIALRHHGNCTVGRSELGGVRATLTVPARFVT